ncbi:MAG: alpha/beta hydrolase [Proteobacteria bacterium]|nr:MAG: alpha/beta hydrolase [Pseudomonadota bacterium]
MVILLHGFPQFADVWSPILSSLAKEGYRAVAVDQRAYSKLAKPSGVSEYSIDKLVQDILNIADQLKAKRFHLVGHDWGGMVAWHLAGKAPGRLISLTSLSTPHPGALHKARTEDFDQQKKSLYILLFRLPFHLAERMLKANHWRLFRKIYQGKVDTQTLEKNILRMSQGKGLTTALNWYRAYDGRAEKSIVPTLFLWGAKDVALGKFAAEKTSDYVIGPYQFEILDGLSHWLMDEAPELISSLLLKHLKRQS